MLRAYELVAAIFKDAYGTLHKLITPFVILRILDFPFPAYLHNALFSTSTLREKWGLDNPFTQLI
ncbi:MAG: hypothetical protein OEZ02_05370 [Anaerolineae bacterium]|nr:hypothetical protein [Anaerolineae bacterium]